MLIDVDATGGIHNTGDAQRDSDAFGGHRRKDGVSDAEQRVGVLGVRLKSEEDPVLLVDVQPRGSEFPPAVAR